MSLFVSISEFLRNNVGTKIDVFEFCEDSWVRDVSKGDLLDFQYFIQMVKGLTLEPFFRTIIDVIGLSCNSMEGLYTEMLLVEESTEVRRNKGVETRFWFVIGLSKESVDMYNKVANDHIGSQLVDKEEEVVNLIQQLEDEKSQRKEADAHIADMADVEANSDLRAQVAANRLRYEADLKIKGDYVKSLEEELAAKIYEATKNSEDIDHIRTLHSSLIIEATESDKNVARLTQELAYVPIALADKEQEILELEAKLKDGVGGKTSSTLSSIYCGTPMKEARKKLDDMDIKDDIALIERLTALALLIGIPDRGSFYFIILEDMGTRFDNNPLGPYAKRAQPSDRPSKKEIVRLMKMASKVNNYLISKGTLLRILIRLGKFDNSSTDPSVFLSPGSTTLIDPAIYCPLFLNENEGREIMDLFETPSYADVTPGDTLFYLLSGDKEVPDDLAALYLNRPSLNVVQGLESKYPGIKTQMYTTYSLLKSKVGPNRLNEEAVVVLPSGWIGKCKLDQPIVWSNKDLNLADIATSEELRDRKTPISIGDPVVLDGTVKKIGSESFDPSIQYYPTLHLDQLAWSKDKDISLPVYLPIAVANDFSTRKYLEHVPSPSISPAWEALVTNTVAKRKIDIAKNKLSLTSESGKSGVVLMKYKASQKVLKDEISVNESIIRDLHVIPNSVGSSTVYGLPHHPTESDVKAAKDPMNSGFA